MHQELQNPRLSRILAPFSQPVSLSRKIVRHHWLNPVLACLLLTSCGGGGGGGSSDDPGPVISAPSQKSFNITFESDPSTGFNDPISASPVGGNTATTVGEQRQKVIEEAARIWSEALDINTTITLKVSFSELQCNSVSGVVGTASPNEVRRNFAGAPLTDTWYVIALANNLARTDLSPNENDINATFNSLIGTPGCLGGTEFYYGFDGNSGSDKIDLLHIVLHELGHGLGFISLLDVSSGAFLSNTTDSFTVNIRDSNFTAFSQLNDAQRQTSIVTQAIWGGSAVTAGMETLALGTLDTGSGSGVLLYTPAVLDEGSSLSHWDTVLTPDELMEPNTPDQGVNLLSAIDIGSMLDTGWPMDEDADQDNDGLPNVWEVLNGLNPRENDAADDPDMDSLTNAQEFANKTAPNNPDTDGDTLTDGDEINIHNLDPTKADTDGDGTPDNLEI